MMLFCIGELAGALVRSNFYPLCVPNPPPIFPLPTKHDWLFESSVTSAQLAGLQLRYAEDFPASTLLDCGAPEFFHEVRM